MKILCACEESQAVTIELRRLGHEAYSCDIIPCSGGHPEWHIRQDVLPLLNGNCEFDTTDGAHHQIVGRWDMIIAHPPCTYLTNAANRVRNAPGREQKRVEAFEFFMQFVNADCKKIAVENPCGYANSHYRPADQTIHPYYFGDPWLKRTCLWLKGLPPLVADQMLPKPEPLYIRTTEKGYGKKIYTTEMMPHTKDRAKLRSKTAPGIARAMAEQWAREVAP
ncbi:MULTISPECIES: DNA cytosine methyltransferase [unclassified Oscillibacter]|uniref:DNA cytosine methyltransferase n=1 Tax=unclassified Oscillibacter TaxID=2629304 RepID=UPI0025D7E94D|nr:MULTISPECIES: DNA cytosine methyltransferase [unclassified Oscillibacter]